MGVPSAAVVFVTAWAGPWPAGGTEGVVEISDAPGSLVDTAFGGSGGEGLAASPGTMGFIRAFFGIPFCNKSFSSAAVSFQRVNVGWERQVME